MKAAERQPPAKTLPLTALVSEGPQCRAYLARVRRAGLRFRRLVVMVSPRHPASGRPVARYLPSFLRLPIAEKTQDLACNYWPRRLRSRHADLVRRIGEVLGDVVDQAAETLEEILGEMPWESYGDRVDRVWADGLGDPSLARALAAESGTVLYTGGGMVRSNLLGLPGLRFLHIHPGWLPNVRGADGLLWSVLVRGRPAASAFFMAAGLDTGDLIAAREFPALEIPVPGDRPADDVLYRALFSFCDPLLRAEVLVRDVLGSGEDLARIPSRPQDLGKGTTYHFMETRLRRLALRRIFT